MSNIAYRPDSSSQSLDRDSFCYGSGISLVIGGIGLQASSWTLSQILGLYAQAWHVSKKHPYHAQQGVHDDVFRIE